MKMRSSSCLRPSLRNEHGGILVMTLYFIPLLATVVFGLGAILINLTSKKETLHICRDESLKLQQKIATELQQLLDMNPEAQRLRQRRSRAERRLAEATLSGNPPAIATATAYLLFVKMQQYVFAAQQRSHFTNVTMQAAYTEREIRRRLGRANRIREVQHLALTPARLHMIARPASSITPDYFIAPAFSRRQIIDVTMELITMDESLGYVTDTGDHLKTLCSTTLIQRGTLWQPALNAANL